MNLLARYALLVLLALLGLHFLLTLTSPQYSQLTSSSSNSKSANPNSKNLLKQVQFSNPAPSQCHLNQSSFYNTRRGNATFVMLARNSDVDDAAKTIRDIEDRFNSKFRYPYVFLLIPDEERDDKGANEQWSDDFKKRITILSQAEMNFGLIPKDHWNQPYWIDENRATEERQKMSDDGVIYGGSIPYRNKCRYNSGFFYKHKLMEKYRWYWKLEPGVHYTCDIDFDPFIYMEDHNKVYGFTMAVYEFIKTIPTLWDHVKDFTKLYPSYVQKDNSVEWISSDEGETYNTCHFWSNFEIADMEFWRGNAYQTFFDYLDRKGGFYYERWGDAPVHTIALSLFLKKNQIHFFDNIGYELTPNQHCPDDEAVWSRGRCTCNSEKSLDNDLRNSCLPQWKNIWKH